ncbi:MULTISPECIES: hypothetical protein [Sorangium]|uniref:Nucleotide-binding protein n=1 Tax=Sorangium cellulosum TaxID=56 RepID=A0A4P2QWS0_SORCE|nr:MULTISPECIES: hypothetical protein [Sorangium]AUX34957.1 hypothetical protein SOCE836_071370 [Sorangium cellulosum]WCQ94264.1 hypothetical protein NQZ70_07021 [Sorangium sp. Soce836]
MRARSSIPTVGRLSRAALAALAAHGCAGCNALLGLEDGILVEERCEPLSAVACYTGPPATEGVGACRTGLRRCNASGDGYGPCEGEVTPAPERCGNAADDDCDGAVDEADGGAGGPAAGGGDVCACDPGAVEACPYGGPPGTLGVGACSAGQRTCGSDGRWGACTGEITPRAEDCATPADEDCSGGGDCGAVIPGGPLGALVGGSGRQRARALAAGRDFAVLGGDFEGSLDLGAGPIATGADRDVFVARIEADGAIAWVRRLVDRGHGALRALAVDAEGDIAVAGELAGVMGAAELTAPEAQGFVVKLDAWGELRWGTLVSGKPQDVAVWAAGDVAVASALPGQGGSDVAIARLSAGGRQLWERVFGGPGTQEPTGVAVDAYGDVLLTGTFEGDLQFGEGAPHLSSAGMSDVFLAKLDEGGEHVASQSFGDGRRQHGGDIAIGPGGEIALSGTFEGLLGLGGSTLFSEGFSAFVVELGAAREHRFSRAYAAEQPPRLALEADGGLVLAGTVEGPTDLGGGPLDGAGRGSDIVVARLDAEGRHVWSKRLGPGTGESGGSRSAAGVAAFVDRGHVLLAGTVEGSVDLDGAAAQARAADILLVRLAP